MNESPRRALAVVTAVVVVCAAFVSTAVVLLRPVQQDNRLLQEARNVLQLTGREADAAARADAEVLARFRALDARIVDLASGRFEPNRDAFAFDAREAERDPEFSEPIPAEADRARLGRRGRQGVLYLVWGDAGLERIVLPVYGTGMWSTIRGLIALEPDFDTIAGALFYEQAETPGVGDRITHADWLAKWRGRRIYDDHGVPQFAIAAGRVEPASASALHNVDGLSGATVTADAVTAMVQFWFGPWGYQQALERLRAEPPVRPQPQATRR